MSGGAAGVRWQLLRAEGGGGRRLNVGQCSTAAAEGGVVEREQLEENFIGEPVWEVENCD